MDKSAFNPAFRKTYAIAKQIPYRANKRLAILAWCKLAKEAIKA
jgi:hypothetical protein